MRIQILTLILLLCTSVWAKPQSDPYQMTKDLVENPSQLTQSDDQPIFLIQDGGLVERQPKEWLSEQLKDQDVKQPVSVRVTFDFGEKELRATLRPNEQKGWSLQTLQVSQNNLEGIFGEGLATDPFQPEPVENHLGGLALLGFFAAIMGALPAWVVARLVSRPTRSKDLVVEQPVQETHVSSLGDLSYLQAAAVVFLSIEPEDTAHLFSHLSEREVARITQAIVTLPTITYDVREEALHFLADQLEIEVSDIGEFLSLHTAELAAELSDWVCYS